MSYTLTPPLLMQKWVEYCKKCDTGYTETVRYRDTMVEVPKQVIYCMEDFCCSAGISDKKLRAFDKNRCYKATMQRIRQAILARKTRALINSEGNVSGLLFDLKANHGLYPKKAGDNPDGGWNLTLDIDAPIGKGKADDKSTGEPTDNVPPAEETRAEEPVAPPQPPVPKPVYAQYCVY